MTAKPSKKKPSKKTAAKKASSKKAAPKGASPKKSAAPKASAKQAAAKKPAAKKPLVKKAAVKKTEAKEAAPLSQLPPVAFNAKKSKPAPDIEVGPSELEFIEAIDQYKLDYGRPFPSWSEILYVLRELGYSKS